MDRTTTTKNLHTHKRVGHSHKRVGHSYPFVNNRNPITIQQTSNHGRIMIYVISSKRDLKHLFPGEERGRI